MMPLKTQYFLACRRCLKLFEVSSLAAEIKALDYDLCSDCRRVYAYADLLDPEPLDAVWIRYEQRRKWHKFLGGFLVGGSLCLGILLAIWWFLLPERLPDWIGW